MTISQNFEFSSHKAANAFKQSLERIKKLKRQIVYFYKNWLKLKFNELIKSTNYFHHFVILIKFHIDKPSKESANKRQQVKTFLIRIGRFHFVPFVLQKLFPSFSFLNKLVSTIFKSKTKKKINFDEFLCSLLKTFIFVYLLYPSEKNVISAIVCCDNMIHHSVAWHIEADTK